MDTTKRKQIIFIIAPGNFRDEEYFQTKVVIQSKGIIVNTATLGNLEEVTGTKGGKARPDTAFEKIGANNYNGIVLVGGEGAKIYFENEYLHQVVRDYDKDKKLIGAICIAPAILGYAGILTNHEVTSFPSQKEFLTTKAKDWKEESIVISKNIITACGPEASMSFGDQIAKHLLS